ncbi:hypothetical protein JDV02_003346 [Purpureocillium takamizusanense]|uniref:Uncharacterized protein n=1 Tax=Purpureocillium takamizusanense TaxID=2060973 RepID=A0A9Q8QDH7_9HYPO|nr:uncharacterized protein JDV02_003346 [Purpureocillium takamizusanense]UNI16964.1 hypothetical protein JDV02_003346 [Purpureocillium takamizusanense]
MRASGARPPSAAGRRASQPAGDMASQFPMLSPEHSGRHQSSDPSSPVSPGSLGRKRLHAPPKQDIDSAIIGRELRLTENPGDISKWLSRTKVVAYERRTAVSSSNSVTSFDIEFGDGNIPGKSLSKNRIGLLLRGDLFQCC